MYFCVAMLLDDLIQNEIRKKVLILNEKYDIGINASLLPQHVSLKSTFMTDRIDVLTKYFDTLSIERDSIDIEAHTIELIPQEENGVNSALLWYTIAENEPLRKLHNQLNDDLPMLLGIDNSRIDGTGFKFHSTIAYGKKRFETYRAIFENEKFLFQPFKTDVRKIALFCSHEKEIRAGTFYVYRTRRLAGISA